MNSIHQVALTLPLTAPEIKVLACFADTSVMNFQAVFAVLLLTCLPVDALADQRHDLSRAQRAYQQGDLSTAQALLTNTLLQQPGNADALYLMGNIKQQQGDRQAAEAAYRQYVRQTTSTPDPERLIQLRRNGFY